MIRATLWAEITISGFIFLVGIVFTFFCVFQITDLSFLKLIKEYPTLSPIIIIIFSYIIGFSIHRLIYVFSILIGILFEKDQKKKNESELDLHKKIYIAQCGSERLNMELQYQFNNYALSRLILIGIPFLLTIFSFWFFITRKNEVLIFTFILPIILLIVIILINLYKIQKAEYKRLLSISFEDLKEIKKSSN